MTTTEYSHLTNEELLRRVNANGTQTQLEIELAARLEHMIDRFDPPQPKRPHSLVTLFSR